MNEHTPDAPERHDESLTTLLKDLRDESTALLREEVALAKQEMSEKVSTVGNNAAQLVAGGLIAYAGAVVLFLALAVGVYGLLIAAEVSHMTAGWLAPLIVGGVLTALGYGMVKKAISTLQHTSATPERTVESVKHNAQWAKEKVTA